MADEVFFLEHPRRGICVALPGDRDEKFHWSWSKPRSEALMITLAKARVMLRLAPPDTKIMHDMGELDPESLVCYNRYVEAQ